MGAISWPGPRMHTLGGLAVAHGATYQDKEWGENHCMGSCQICSLSKNGICHLRVDNPHSCLPCCYRATTDALGRDMCCLFTLVLSDCSADFHVCPALGGPLRAPVL